MKIKRIVFVLGLLFVFVLSGCSMRTIDTMYSLPKRSESDGNLQAALDRAMNGMEFSAPLTGENQQAVQMADLDGDGVAEFIVFAKCGQERPLRILIFKYTDEMFIHVDTIESNGSAFDMVEYVQMDGTGGLEMVVGRLLDAEVIRSVCVYSFAGTEAEQLFSANYSRFLTVDLDTDGLTELFLLRPSGTETNFGIAEMYGIEHGAVEKSNEVTMSEDTGNLKRIITGKLHGDQIAVYVASTTGDTALITDVFAVVDGRLTNVSVSNESGTSVQTIRNYYIYADDIDNDGVVELPQLMNMTVPEDNRSIDRHDLIRWYAMTAAGAEVDKMFTYHNFVGGWYLQLEDRWASRLMVQRQGSAYEFFIWSEDFQTADHVLTIYTFTGQNREIEASQEGRFLLHRTDTAIYAASLGDKAQLHGFTQENTSHSFQLIKLDWKTGET